MFQNKHLQKVEEKITVRISGQYMKGSVSRDFNCNANNQHWAYYSLKKKTYTDFQGKNHFAGKESREMSSSYPGESGVRAKSESGVSAS